MLIDLSYVCAHIAIIGQSIDNIDVKPVSQKT